MLRKSAESILNKSERKRPQHRYSLKQRLAVVGIGTAMAGGLAACGENVNATPEETTTPPAATATENPGEPTPTETEAPVESVELLPNGEELLTPAELIDLREQGGDTAVTEYFRPSLAKIGMSYEEVMADPTEFGNRFGSLYTSYLELSCNLSKAMPDELDSLDEDAFVAEVGTWVEPMLVYTTKVFASEDMFRQTIESAANRQWWTHQVEEDTLNTYTISIVEGEDVQSHSQNNGYFTVKMPIHYQDDSILRPHIGPKGAPIDTVELADFTIYVDKDDGIITVE